jgi:L-seryl-tRNA(Ser) seleniumtransferase
VVVHTNLGRSCLADAAIDHMVTVARRYSNLEFDLTKGHRGSRYSAVEEVICEISGAEAAMVVNNNAGAVLLCLDTLARNRSVILSRGELVEIGGSFRIPDVMTKSGARLQEVGTTNRTHLADYEMAIGTDTGLLLKVHTSNYSIVGFTSAVPLADLVSLGSKFNIPVMEDLGSGNFIDLGALGLHSEPTVQESVSTGADVITFSGDKLLGGPQAGLIVGKKAAIDAIKRNPLTRALRIDKLTLAALEATLNLYRDPQKALAQIPTLNMITAQKQEIERKALSLKADLETLNSPKLTLTIIDLPSKVGGGSLPMLELPSRCLGIQISDRSANTIEKSLRHHQPPIIGRIENDTFIIDPRTLGDNDAPFIVAAFRQLLDEQGA